MSIASGINRRQSFYGKSRKELHPLEIVRMRNIIEGINPYDLKQGIDFPPVEPSLPVDPIPDLIKHKKVGRVYSAPVVPTNSFSTESESASPKECFA